MLPLTLILLATRHIITLVCYLGVQKANYARNSAGTRNQRLLSL